MRNIFSSVGDKKLDRKRLMEESYYGQVNYISGFLKKTVSGNLPSPNMEKNNSHSIEARASPLVNKATLERNHTSAFVY